MKDFTPYVSTNKFCDITGVRSNIALKYVELDQIEELKEKICNSLKFIPINV
jgi:hypothetical protein